MTEEAASLLALKGEERPGGLRSGFHMFHHWLFRISCKVSRAVTVSPLYTKNWEQDVSQRDVKELLAVKRNDY